MMTQNIVSLLCCEYICDIYLNMLDFNGLPSSTTYLLTRLQKKVSSCEPKEELPLGGLYNYDGRQIELFHGLIVDRLTRPRLVAL